MKVGIDSYCYHRYFGEMYPDQQDPGVRWTFQDFVRRAAELRVDGVSLESCFFESLEPSYLSEIKAVLDEQGARARAGLGPPDGLEAGRSEKAWREMNALIPKAQFMGADIMRIVASSLDVPLRTARAADRRHREDAQGKRQDRRGQRRRPGAGEPHRLHLGGNPARFSSGSGPRR